jgi:[NiFe] hydrogenase assembly HybE family chaperone
MASMFEGSYLGDDSKLADDTRLECGICWHVYDPAEGDDYWQIAAGTPFSRLPEHWRCPVCDAEKHKFMVLMPEAPVTPEEKQAVTAAMQAEHGCSPATCSCGKGGEKSPAMTGALDEARLGALTAAYLKAEARMRGLPIYNQALSVELIGFRREGADLVGIVLTPWCMNIVVVPGGEIEALREGQTRARSFPSGKYDFTGGRLDGVGAIELCSLFSPMDEFAEMEVARLVAKSAIEGLYEAPPPPEPAAVSRRGFLSGKGAPAGGEAHP